MADRYQELIDSVRELKGLTTNDVSDAQMLKFLNRLLETYSRHQGIRKPGKITYVAGQDTYDLNSEVFHLEKVYWNDTAPTTILQPTQGIDEEEYYFPSLRLIRKLEQALYYLNLDEIDQEWKTKMNDSTKQLVLRPTPETDIYMLYRLKYDKDNYPPESEDVLAAGLTAKMLEWIKSTGLYQQLGGVGFNNKGITADIKENWRKFMSNIQTPMIGKS